MRIDNIKAREYYIKETSSQQWSTRQLKRNINTLYYEHILSSATQQAIKTTQIPNEQLPSEQVRDFTKDPYILEFLQLTDNSHLKINILKPQL